MPDKGNNSIKVPILFTPREIRKYQETIRLDFNGLYQVDIIIKAQGIPLNLDLRDPDQTITDLGIVSVGGHNTKTVPIINRSQKSVKFQISPRDLEAFNRSALTINVDSAKDNVLKPKEALQVKIGFNPKTRLPPFSQEIMLRVEGVEEVRQIFSVTGVAHGIELKLMENTLAFGAVVVDSQLTKPMQLSNFGDVKANFNWDAKAFSKNFTISPAQGYVNPNANLDIEITFHPKDIGENNKPLQLQQKVQCEVTGGEPMQLNLVGKSVAQESKEEHSLNFNSVVRKATT
jgi:hydrocephalus-inducing protein